MYIKNIFIIFVLILIQCISSFLNLQDVSQGNRKIFQTLQCSAQNPQKLTGQIPVSKVCHLPTQYFDT